MTRFTSTQAAEHVANTFCGILCICLAEGCPWDTVPQEKHYQTQDRRCTLSTYRSANFISSSAGSLSTTCHNPDQPSSFVMDRDGEATSLPEDAPDGHITHYSVKTCASDSPESTVAALQCYNGY